MSKSKDIETCLSSKEVKALHRENFENEYQEHYPAEFLTSLGFERLQCPSCNHFFWRHNESTLDVCGDSNCVGQYTFIGKGCGIGSNELESPQKITFGEAWNIYVDSMKTYEHPSTPIPRFPVVARWRTDVDFVAAGIYCFQPYCVTGEVDPPANPLVCPQFCLRFNDLDSIGLSGRHHAGFIMIGNQAFNYGDDIHYFADEVVGAHLHWVTKGLNLNLKDITLIEDLWAGGGNMGPCVEIFTHGLEVGNMVLMKYRYDNVGELTPLDVKVVDVGIGLERIPWLVNGTLTSYQDTHAYVLEYLQEKTGVELDNEIWQKFAPYSCLLNVDECENIDQAWEDIAKELGVDVQDLRSAVEAGRDIYIIADHTRALMIPVYDGALPSQSGSGANLRNIIRRVFAILNERNWISSIGFDGIMHIFELHKKQLEPLYGKFADFSSLEGIIRSEFDKYENSTVEVTKKLKQLMKKKKDGLSLNDWIILVSSHGLPADKIAEVLGEPIPGNLYYEIATLDEKTSAKQILQLYDTVKIPATRELYKENERQMTFSSKVVTILDSVELKLPNRVVILEETCFYPTSGGQEHDIGTITINGEEYNVIDAIKVGGSVLHTVDREVTVEPGTEVTGIVDEQRRETLRQLHSATHILNHAAQMVLGPHVWQNGASKKATGAHIDITHYKIITEEEILEIERMSNELIRSRAEVVIKDFPREEAERLYGFSLYQGGVVPGNSIRVVNMMGIDIEACCGTHVQNVSEIGFLRITRYNRVSDGVSRLYFVAGDLASQYTMEQQRIIYKLRNDWSVDQEDIVSTGERFFAGYKSYKAVAPIALEMTLRAKMAEAALGPVEGHKLLFVDHTSDASVYIRTMPQMFDFIKDHGLEVVIVGGNYVVMNKGSDFEEEFMGSFEDAVNVLKERNADALDYSKAKIIKKNKLKVKTKVNGKKKVINHTGIAHHSLISCPKAVSLKNFFEEAGFILQ
ncbi:hypothetical protein PCE1_003375 [Barthelona sp. PCE]